MNTLIAWLFPQTDPAQILILFRLCVASAIGKSILAGVYPPKAKEGIFRKTTSLNY